MLKIGEEISELDFNILNKLAGDLCNEVVSEERVGSEEDTYYLLKLKNGMDLRFKKISGGFFTDYSFEFMEENNVVEDFYFIYFYDGKVTFKHNYLTVSDDGKVVTTFNGIYDYLGEEINWGDEMLLTTDYDEVKDFMFDGPLSEFNSRLDEREVHPFTINHAMLECNPDVKVMSFDNSSFLGPYVKED